MWNPGVNVLLKRFRNDPPCLSDTKVLLNSPQTHELCTVKARTHSAVKVLNLRVTGLALVLSGFKSEWCN